MHRCILCGSVLSTKHPSLASNRGRSSDVRKGNEDAQISTPDNRLFLPLTGVNDSEAVQAARRHCTNQRWTHCRTLHFTCCLPPDVAAGVQGIYRLCQKERERAL
ncbi:hypothetical protein F2P79_003688 [Pimephales promelas]|nr:hypothetical protein F2P79_003688 [Pimephales promelas]